MVKPSQVSEIEFFHNNKRLVFKILPGGFKRNLGEVEKKYGWFVGNSYRKAWNAIFGGPPKKPVIHVDKASGPDKTIKTTVSVPDGKILQIEEVKPIIDPKQ